MAVLDEVERAALTQADHDLSDLQHALEVAARNEALDADVFDRLDATARETVARVNQNLPPQVDADARDEIRRRLIYLLTLRPNEKLRALDVADRALLEAEAIRHVMRDLLQEQPPAELRESAPLIRLLESWLPSLPVKQLAELLGISERQLQRRRHEGSSSHRMQVVARLVAVLRHAWTDAGVHAWFLRPRGDLAGQAPLELLDDAGSERALLLAARSGRVQGGV
jgi:transcriptional regulator with XRE-family HTH domain